MLPKQLVKINDRLLGDPAVPKDQHAMICDHCPAQAVIIAPGSDGERDLFLLRRLIPRRQWCLACARLAGWPWLNGERAA